MNRSFFLRSLAAISGSGLVLNGFAESMTQIVPGYADEPSDAAGDADWGLIRRHFSLPENYRYFNTAGIGAVPTPVRQAVMAYWNNTEIYPAPGHNLVHWNGIKKELLPLIGGGGDVSCMSLTNSTTEGINIILNGLNLKTGDEIITSSHEHPALHAPLINLAQRKGLGLKVFDPDLTEANQNLERIESLISSKTKLIFVSLVTCTTGQLLPAKQLSDLAHQHGVLLALDGAQSTGHVELNLLDWGIDFYTSGGQKWLLGPKRTGFLYVRDESLELLRPTTVGAYSEAGYAINDQSISWAEGGTRFEYATQNDSLFEGLKRSVEMIKRIGLVDVYRHGYHLSEHFYQALLDIPQIRILSSAKKACRTAILTFGSKQYDCDTLASKLRVLGFRLRVVKEAQVNGVRASFHIYNDLSEVDALLAAIQELHT